MPIEEPVASQRSGVNLIGYPKFDWVSNPVGLGSVDQASKGERRRGRCFPVSLRALTAVTGSGQAGTRRRLPFGRDAHALGPAGVMNCGETGKGLPSALGRVTKYRVHW